jgi:hypothetical protein
MFTTLGNPALKFIIFKMKKSINKRSPIILTIFLNILKSQKSMYIPKRIYIKDEVRVI